MKKEKGINFKIDEELYKKLKVKLAKEGQTIKQFMLNLIKKELEEE